MPSFLSYLIIIILTILSCNNKKKNNKTSNEINLQYQTFLSNNLLLFKPSSKFSQLPLIFVIDAHADTNIVKKSFHYFLKKHPCFLAISLDVKNNTEDFLKKIDNEIETLCKNNEISNIIITGFSGGARMALYYSLSKKIDALVLFGAGIDPNLLQNNLNFPIIMTSGYKDFNFIETYYSPNSNIVDNEKIISLYHKGFHEWPDSLFINEIFNLIFLKLNNNEINYTPEFHTNILLDEFKKYELLYKLSNTNKQFYKTQLDNLKNNSGFIEEIQKLEKSILNEISQHEIIINALETKSLEWWKDYYNTIISGTKSEDFISQAYWYRIKGFIGIILYSKLNNLYNKNEFNNNYKKLIDIYKLFEPDNKEMKYFLALYFYKNNKINEAKLIIKELINENFINFSRLKKDFNRLNFEN